MPNYQLKIREKRLSDRKSLTGLMPGRFIMGGQEVSARPVDISSHGIGVLIAQEYAVGTQATLSIKDKIIEFEVKWGQPDFGKHDLWRFGLVCVDPSIDVKEVFEMTGCFK
jgi:hypothetical protein